MSNIRRTFSLARPNHNLADQTVGVVWSRSAITAPQLMISTASWPESTFSISIQFPAPCIKKLQHWTMWRVCRNHYLPQKAMEGKKRLGSCHYTQKRLGSCHYTSWNSYKLFGLGYTVKPILGDHMWAHKKWSLYRGSLLKEVKRWIGILPFRHDRMVFEDRQSLLGIDWLWSQASRDYSQSGLWISWQCKKQLGIIIMSMDAGGH